MSQEIDNLTKIEPVSKPLGFWGKNRVLIVGLAGIVSLHIGWYTIVMRSVPEGERPKHFPFTLMARLDPFRTAKAEK